jgi:hypothetical protein
MKYYTVDTHENTVDGYTDAIKNLTNQFNDDIEALDPDVSNEIFYSMQNDFFAAREELEKRMYELIDAE